MRTLSSIIALSLFTLAAGAADAADRAPVAHGVSQQATANTITTRDGVQLYYKDWGQG